MTTLQTLRFKQIFLFKTGPTLFGPNALKSFIYYLRSQGKKGVLDFAFSSSIDSVHSNLSIKENLILESVSFSLIRNCDTNLLEKINSLENESLVELIGTLGPLHIKVGELSDSEVKLTSIVKALLASTEYIFLEKPDESLKHEQIALVKKCLEFEAINNNRKVFIRPTNLENWLDLATDIIETDQEHNFQKTKNPFYDQKTTKHPNSQANLTLVKKVS